MNHTIAIIIRGIKIKLEFIVQSLITIWSIPLRKNIAREADNSCPISRIAGLREKRSSIRLITANIDPERKA